MAKTIYKHSSKLLLFSVMIKMT